VDELEEAVSGKKAAVKPNGQPRPGPIGNTQGIIVPDTAPNPYGNSAPDIALETPEEKSFLDKAFEMGDIKVLQKASQGIQDKIDGMVEASGYSVPAMVIGSISKAVVEVFMPTNVIDAVPGGKAGRLAKKGSDAAKKGKNAKNADGGGGKDKNAKENTTDPCKVFEDGVPGDGYRGGKHGKIKEGGYSYDPKRESHHMPADATYSTLDGKSISTDLKPAIQMDKADHHKTASWGSGQSANAYRNTQAALIRSGKSGFMQAIMMDIVDIRSKFGDKYDAAIAQYLTWAKCKGYI
jgi:hypothetical protein